MLRTFRSKLKFWSNIALWPVIIAFIAFYGWSFSGRQSGRKRSAVAVVEETTISPEEMYRMRERYERYYRDIYKDNFDRYAKNLDFQQMALDRLINDTILLNQAQKFKIGASKDEIRNAIKATSYFQKNGQFSPSLYERLLRRMHFTPQQYEESVAQSIILEKMRTLIGSMTPVTDDELREEYIAQNVKIGCDFLVFRSSDHRKDIEVTEEEITAYYNDHKDEFKTQDQIKVGYVQFDPEKLKDEITVEDEDVEDYYTEHLDQYMVPEQVRASHILLKVPPDAPKEKWDETLAKAKEIKKRLDNGESFEALAKEFSDDTTAEKGGDLGFFQKGRMVKPFENAVWDMEIGDISDPVKTRFGYHIIKKTDYQKGRYKSEEEVRDTIIDQIKRERAKELAMEKAQALFDKIGEGDKLSDIAKKENLEFKTTDFFEKNNPPREIGRARQMDDILFNLEVGGVSIPIETYKGVFIFELLEKRAPFVPPLEDCKDKVEAKVKQNKAEQLARAQGEKVLADLKSGMSWDDVAKKYDLKIQSTGEFTKHGYIPRVGSDKELIDELFNMNVGDVTDLKKVRSNFFILKVTSKHDFDEEEFKSKLPELRRKAVATKQYKMLDSYIAQIKSQLQKEGKLTINLPNKGQ